MEFNTSDNSYQPIKSHRLGNASRSVCRKRNMDVKFVKMMSLAYTGYISKNFHPFPPFQLINYCQTQPKLPTNCKTPKFTQQNQQGFPGIRNSRRNLLAQNILLEKKQMCSQPTNIPPVSSPPSPSLGDVESNAHVTYCFFYHRYLSLCFEA